MSTKGPDYGIKSPKYRHKGMRVSGPAIYHSNCFATLNFYKVFNILVGTPTCFVNLIYIVDQHCMPYYCSQKLIFQGQTYQ